ncbi:hypothetical protein A7D27_08790 [Pseudomonas sp. 1D4]|nr:hypothetical protein A7D27_08790 [Pseudomonas sp. 1D4]
MSGNRFLTVDTIDDVRYYVNADYIVAFKLSEDDDIGGILYVAHANTDGARLPLTVSREEANSIVTYLSKL